MPHAFAEIAFTPDVKAAQQRDGSRAGYARSFEGDAEPFNDRLGPTEVDFLAKLRSFYLATVSETGWPYVQHRGGPAGFVRVLDDRHIAFADYAGNRQLISVGNLAGNQRVALIAVDYTQRVRLKLLGTMAVQPLADDKALTAQLVSPGLRARPARSRHFPNHLKETKMKPNHTLKLYHHPLSGHAHRVELALSLMGLPYELIIVDLMKGAHKQQEFLALNPFGQVPVLDDGGTIVFDSNAILVYLASTYDADRRWLPRDAKQQAAVQAWLSVAAGLIAFGPAAARLITLFGAKYNPEDVIGRAHQLLKVMEAQLATRAWLAGANATIADIAGYSYVSAAPEGNVDLSTYPHVRAWLARIEALPGFVPFQRTAIGLAA